MAKRCTCSDHGDDTVFGPCYKCSPKPESAHADNLASELDRLEHPYERVLSDGDGDLG